MPLFYLRRSLPRSQQHHTHVRRDAPEAAELSSGGFRRTRKRYHYSKKNKQKSSTRTGTGNSRRDHTKQSTTMISTQRLLLGACLLAGRTGAFHVPVASSLSEHARSTLAGAGNSAVLVHRRVHSARVLMATAPSGQMQGTIEGRLAQALSPVHLEVINESHMHAGPAKESHFKVRKGRCICRLLGDRRRSSISYQEGSISCIQQYRGGAQQQQTAALYEHNELTQPL